MKKLGFIGILLLAILMLLELSPVFAATKKSNSKLDSQSQIQSKSNNNPIDPFSGLVEVGDHSLYVEYVPGNNNKPLLVLTNGLVYDFSRWNDFTNAAHAAGYGYLKYYFRGQHLSLKAEADQYKSPLFFKSGLTVEMMAEDLNTLLEKLNITEPIHLIGLSYGSTIAAQFAATYPDKISKLVFLAPLVINLDKYNPNGQWVLSNLEILKLMWGPFFGPYFYEAAYKQIYQNYLSQRVIPERVPKELSDMPEVYKESLFHLIRLTRNFDLRTYKFSKFNPKSIHFILAKEEDENVFKDQVLAFDKLNSQSQGSLIWMQNVSHAIPESNGKKAFYYLDFLLNDDKRLTGGQKYIVTDEGLTNWN